MEVKDIKGNKTERTKALSARTANLETMLKAKEERRSKKDQAHQQWLKQLDRAGSDEQALWAAHEKYVEVRKSARKEYHRIIGNLSTETGMVGLPGIDYAKRYAGADAFRPLTVVGARKQVYSRIDAPEKEYVKDSNGAYVRRIGYRHITKSEADDLLKSKGLGRKSIGELETQQYGEKPGEKFDAFEKLLGSPSTEEGSRDVLHQIIGGGLHQFQIAATSSIKREPRSNAGLPFSSGETGGLIKIDLAKIPQQTHVAAQYTQQAAQLRTTLLKSAVLDSNQQGHILRQIETSAEKNMEVLLAEIPFDAILEWTGRPAQQLVVADTLPPQQTQQLVVADTLPPQQTQQLVVPDTLLSTKQAEPQPKPQALNANATTFVPKQQQQPLPQPQPQHYPPQPQYRQQPLFYPQQFYSQQPVFYPQQFYAQQPVFYPQQFYSQQPVQYPYPQQYPPSSIQNPYSQHGFPPGGKQY